MEEEKMLVITHHTGEPHGILGAQVAATYMTQTPGCSFHCGRSDERF